MFVIFDFDGVIVDSERSIFKYFQSVLGNIADIDFKKKVGRTSEEFLKNVTDLTDSQIHDLSLKRREEFLNDVSYYALVPGVIEQIKRLSEFCELAICSNSYVKFILPVLDHYDIKKYFKYIFGIENVSLPKPNPEIYNLGKSNFSGDGFVIEDSVAGVMSAKAAGLKVVAITTSFLRSELFLADYVIDDFSELSNIIQNGN